MVRIALIACLSLLVVPTASSSAMACKNKMPAWYKKSLKRSQQALRDNKPEKAGLIAHTVIGKMGVDRLRAPRVMARAKLLLATAVVRTRGHVPFTRFAAKTIKQRRAHLAEAHGALSEALRRRPEAPDVLARLAESQVLRGETVDALKVLQGLAAEDLLPDTQSMALLVQLLKDSGAKQEASTVLGACRMRAGKQRWRKRCLKPPVVPTKWSRLRSTAQSAWR